MKTFAKNLTVVLTLLALLTGVAMGDVIISQYYEGASNNKWIEITNIGESTVNLASPQLYLCLFTNAKADNPFGVSPDNNQALSGSLAAGSVILFKNSASALPVYALASGTNSTICNFNGDDLVIISTSNSTSAYADRTDIIGNGTTWGADKSFYRNSNVTTDNVTYATDEWTQVTNAAVDGAISSNSEYLGTHLYSGAPTTTSIQFTSSSASVSESSGTYDLTVSITNPDGSNATTANVALTSGSAADINNYTTQAISFPAGSSANQTVTVTITDDSDFEGDETLTFALQSVSGGNSATAGTTSEFNLEITYNDGPNVIINEILADPDATLGDANGDAVVDAEDDEFVELVNKSGETLDISGWNISDAVSIRHVFPEGTSLDNNTSIVVFGAGTPTDIPGQAQVASTGTLGLNNTSDNVILKNASDMTIISYNYGSDAGDNQSIARNPDFTGSFVKHSTITGNPVLFSPGEMNAIADTPLPITLASFTATAVNGTVELAWETATETNNANFVIYRNDVAIASVAGAGTTSEPHSYSYVDNTVVPGVTYTYVLADVDYANTETKYEDDAVTVTLANDLIEADFVVGAAYPNPFNPTAIVPLELSRDAMVKASLYDLNGREIKALVNANFTAGTHELHINGSDLTTGMYLVQVVVENVVDVQKIALMK